MPDWEESVPNPARKSFRRQWLNGALMAKGGLPAWTIPDAPRLQHIVERQAVGDALGLDPQRARGDDVDLASPEPGTAAAVGDDRRRAVFGDDVARAHAVPVLELGQQGDIAIAFANGRLGARHAAELPQARHGLRQPGRIQRRAQRQARCSKSNRDSQDLHPSHDRPFITLPLTVGYGNHSDSSRGSIAKLDEQNSQSTRINPSSPTIASRSSAGNRAITERT